MFLFSFGFGFFVCLFVVVFAVVFMPKLYGISVLKPSKIPHLRVLIPLRMAGIPLHCSCALLELAPVAEKAESTGIIDNIIIDIVISCRLSVPYV